MKRCLLFTVSIFVFLSSFAPYASAQSGTSKGTQTASRLLGTWEAMEEGETIRLVFKSATLLVFEEEESAYELVPGIIRVTDPYEGIVDYKYSLQGDALTVTLPEGDRLKFRRVKGSVTAGATERRDENPPNSNQNHLLVGKFMSYASASSSGGSSSWTTYAIFDGRGNFQYSSESAHSTQSYDQTGTNTGSGIAYGSNSGNKGTYRVAGDRILVKFPDGSTGEGVVTERFQDGSIGAFKYDGKTYAR